MHPKLINAHAELANAEEILNDYNDKHGPDKENKDAYLADLFRRTNKEIGLAIADSSPLSAKRANLTAIMLHYYVNENY